ncbi:MAG: PQQ-dependent sugar dehydrogenase, partial [Nocardioides sp.]
MRLLFASLPLVIAGLACTPTTSESAPEPTAPAASSAAATAPTASSPPDQDEGAAGDAPRLKVTRVIGGLDIPWDVQQIPGGLLVTERDRARLLLVKNGKARSLRYPTDDVWVSGETGLMSIAVDPGFDDNRRIYLCQGGFTGSGTDVRVVAWRLNAKQTRVTKPQVLLSGLPVSSGRHGGCRLLIDRETGALHVGTGDAAIGTNPRDLTSLGGKTLRLDRKTGEPWPDNPYIDAADPQQRYVVTSGHRNVQGLAQRRDGTVWSVEHGSFRDDEVNLLEDGGDYGWNPVPGYNEEVPMTDQSLPGPQIDARWRSGTPTIATSGASWVRGSQWGRYDGALAMGALAGERLVFLRFTKAGQLRQELAPAALRAFGRLRSVTTASNGDLLVTTANGGGSDAVLRVRPRGGRRPKGKREHQPLAREGADGQRAVVPAQLAAPDPGSAGGGDRRRARAPAGVDLGSGQRLVGHRDLFVVAGDRVPAVVAAV